MNKHNSVIRCQLVLVGGTPSSEGFYYLPYLPYCVSTLKIGIKNLEERSIRIRIRPKNSRNDDQFCCGFDDENRGIMVIWGGGSEEGIESNLEISESKYLYFLLYHKSDLISSSYDLTLEVNKLFGYGEIRSEIEEMKIKLEPLSESTEIIRARYIQESSEINFDGTKICCYYPRWFPELQSRFLLTESSDFYSNSNEPPFTLNIKRKSSGDTYDAISLTHEKKGNIAVVSGDMDGATVHCELYALCSGVYVIRIWLFWISKDQFRNKLNLEVIKVARERGMSTPELPDCERYDIVSDEIGNILWIGTDFHWQEYWYTLTEGENIAYGNIIKYVYPIKETLSRLIVRAYKSLNFGQTGTYNSGNAYQEIIEHLTTHCKSSPVHSEKDMAQITPDVLFQGLTDADPQRERWNNFLRSHVPYVTNGYVLPKMVTKEVTHALL